MALITITGYPCSGKTRRANELKAALEARIQDPSYAGPQLKVIVLSDDELNVSRDAYKDSRAEKPARAALFTAAQRHMRPDTLLVVDAMNYIKGFRYQLYCAAREAKLRVCTVFVVATPELCREWNAAREDGHAYAPDVLDNLLTRYEEPSSMVRWDAPLFTVPWTDAAVPADDIWRAVTEGAVKPPNAGTQAIPKAPTDALRTLEATTTSLVALILSHSSQSSGAGGQLTLPLTSLSPASLSSPNPTSSAANTVTLTLPPRPLTLSELQRLKRQFVAVHKKAITLGTVEKGAVDWGEGAVAEKFAQYVEENLRA
ncbi:hypothetical protein EIP86_005082 [Pleurotus ostreatoroseus]|nr:hypothetical protein EIP86_005082 [Pleurotus ostreatoroseus]